jgi:enoyl-CoA hydratase/carnithine racemase
MAAGCLGLDAVVERLQSPDASAIWSALGDVRVLMVDVRGVEVPPPAGVWAAVATKLAILPCPTVAWCDAATPAAVRAQLAAFDVVVESGAELEAVQDGVTRAPFAAATLAHVLRAGRTASVEDALLLESLAYATLQGGPELARWLATRPAPAALAASPAPVVDVARDGDVLAITLVRPERHNAFSARMRDALVEALGLAEADATLDVVLRGAGPSFCSGGDLDEFGTCADPPTAHLIRMTRSPARLLANLGARVRAEVHGACIGAGIELAAFAGRVTATPDAFFQLPEVAMGLIPGAGGTASLPRRIGRQRTAYLALTGARIDAATALAWGLVDAIAASGTTPDGRHALS